MDFHLERSLRLKTADEIEHNSLYSWAITEVDDDGGQVGHDQIPWAWTLYFTATSVTMSDSIFVRAAGEDIVGAVEEERRIDQIIRIKLRPGDARHRLGPLERVPAYRMFGTDRVIDNFELQIHPIRDGAQEYTKAWASASYSAEADFLTETEPDIVIFYLFVRPETFAKYAAKLSMAAVDEIVMSAHRVSGMYSEWSPSISPRSVKVLATGKEQEVRTASGEPFHPPRIKEVGEMQLFINRKLQFGPSSPTEDGEEEEIDGRGTVRIEEPRMSTSGQDMTALIKSLQGSARWIIGLLVVLIIAVLMKR